jgi:cytochrome b subunit of formate dehydrogenase
MRPRLACEILAIIVLAFPGIARAQGGDPLDCQMCHTDKATSLKASVHASLACATCHAGIKVYPHPKSVPLPKCSDCHPKESGEYDKSVHGQAAASGNQAAPTCAICHGDAHTLTETHTWAFKKAIPDLCAMCHADIAKQYSESIHGQVLARGSVDVPVCTTCHSAHLILAPTNPGSTVYPTHIRETCGQCHGNLQLARTYGLPANRLLTYDASFHGLASKEGSIVVANCASCHGIHLILPSFDPRSSINARNLSETCGKCHPGAGQRFAIGPVHELPGTGSSIGEKAVGWVRLFYLIVIPLTIGLMFVHNLGDWLRKLAQMRLRKVEQSADMAAPPTGEDETRMYCFERFQHLFLLSSFIVLVWTGFALKYPNGWWAQLFLAWESRGRPVRGLAHRAAAVLFMAVAGIHIVSLLKSRRLRRHWKELWPRWSDVPQALAGFMYNVGLRRGRPPLPEHNYIHKAEYWAVVWGTAIMTITGLMLWAHNRTMQWLPRVFMDLTTTVHLYEAILAALAILVWHFYFVIFDPDVYPMDTAWLTGKSPRRREAAPVSPVGQEINVPNEGVK